MKKIFLAAMILVAFALFTNVQAQQGTPPGAGDKDLRDTGIKGRSNELERIDRDARKDENKKESNKKNGKASKEQPSEDSLEAKYTQIKEDFENIQTAQAAVVNAYTMNEKINYGQIAGNAAEVNKRALRLSENLFPPTEDSKTKKEEKTSPASKSVRDLIVELDNTVGAVVSSPMFQNMREVDPKVAEKTRSDLETVINLSDALKREAEKLNANQK